MTAPTTLDPVVAYAAAVRDHLADLGPEVLDDLTGGLEADLAESLADALGGAAPTDTDLTARFGAAQAYAAELRESAGLPPAGSTRRRPTIAERLTRTGHAWARGLDALPGGAQTRDFLLALRPVWWVLRGWALMILVGASFDLVLGAYAISPLPPQTLQSWVLTGAAIVLSVQLGRGAWTLPRGWSTTWRIASVVLVPVAIWASAFVLAGAGRGPMIVTIPASGSTGPQLSESQNAVLWAMRDDTSGIVVDGVRATNLFVYAKDGTLVEGAQVFDQGGRPVVLGPTDTLVSGGLWAGGWWTDDSVGQARFPLRTTDGLAVRNAFPQPEIWWADGAVRLDDSGVPLLPVGLTPSTPAPRATPVVLGSDDREDATTDGAKPGTADPGTADPDGAGPDASGAASDASNPSPSATS
ncbi:hypothetical protein IGS67_00380 [Flavimobilis sp. GY10621]|uniref:Uncharacterized protein n=1 Tax=Flavimobilis rhizosphaerae TaxID=2775421 RepID=A0ABR9DLJ4_9MICO|nr:hypothetical protein [Flavimobilis rhizosphaerae]MBD9697958.1 hypothetical protein [Flavimobilis rhizosphaerae]